MGRLAGFKYRQIVKRLKVLGFEFNRQAAGSHDIWFNPTSNRYTTIPNHLAICPKARCVPSSNKPASSPEHSSARKNNPSAAP